MPGKQRKPEDRFWEKVDKRSEDECWNWTAYRDRNGYGTLEYPPPRRGFWRAHRFSYELHFGPIPEGLNVCHRCDNPSCVNPAHLWVGTTQDNNRDRDAKGRTAPQHGEHNPSSKLRDADVRRIRELAEKGIRNKELALMFGVSKPLVTLITQRKIWKHVRKRRSDAGIPWEPQ